MVGCRALNQGLKWLKPCGGLFARGHAAGVKKAAFNLCRLVGFRALLNLGAGVVFIFYFADTADARVIRDLRRLGAEIKNLRIEGGAFNLI